MTISVLKITGITSPEGISVSFDYLCTRFLGLLHNCINYAVRYCKKAREFLASSGVRITEYNIDKDKAKSQEMMQKSGSKGVPVIDVEGIIIRGFSPEVISSAITKKRTLSN